MYEKYFGVNGNHLYHRILADVLKHGVEVFPRGKRTLEIQAVTHILEPMQRVLTVPGRGANPFFNVAENLAILGAWQDQRSWLGTFNKNYLQFFDNDIDEQTHAFYGDRLRRYPDDRVPVDQLQEVTKKLIADRDTRQAMAVLWHPVLDNEPGHRDYPCNFAVKFAIRDFKEVTKHHLQMTVSGGNHIVSDETTTKEVLHMTVFNRSNDIHWGLFGVNLSQFSFIQEVMAKTLGVRVGHQIHISDSLHLYTDPPHSEITERMSKFLPGFDIYNYTAPTPMFSPDLKAISWGAIDRDLTGWKKRFDTLMKVIGAGQGVVPLAAQAPGVEYLSWPFLRDAWYFLQAYLHRRARMHAVRMLDWVQDNALWLAGVEWMVRNNEDQVDIDFIKEGIQRRFPVGKTPYIGRMETGGRDILAQQDISQYILSSSILEAATAKA